jgi:NDP-sugar pyrophosphorylase family protein
MPIMEIVMRQLQQHGFRDITIAAGYMADLIKAYFQDGSKLGVKLDYSLESQPLGTAGPLSLIEGLDETFLMMNADVLTNIDYHELVKYHKRQKALATIGAYERQVTIDLGVIIGNGNYHVKTYVEKPTTSYLVSMGIYVFEPEILSYIRKGEYLDFPDLVRVLLQDGRTVSYYPFDGYWLDIGRHDDYATAAVEFEKLKSQFIAIKDSKKY